MDNICIYEYMLYAVVLVVFCYVLILHSGPAGGGRTAPVARGVRM